MGKIIELCGSPGVGKSSIFNELERRNNKKYRWTTVSNTNPYGDKNFYDFVRDILIKVQRGKNQCDSQAKKLEGYYDFVRFIYREIKKGKNFVDLEALKAAGNRFVSEHPKYIEACWGNIFARQTKSLNGLDLRFEKAEFIYRIIKKNQVLSEKITDRFTLIDEGFINMIDRGLYQSLTPLEEKQEIHNLLEVMPLPDALVYIEIELNENAKRLLSREELRDMHKGLSFDELMDFTQECRQRILTAIEYLENKGTPVLYLDSSNSIKENADKIIGFTENMELHGSPSISENTLVY